MVVASRKWVRERSGATPTTSAGLSGKKNSVVNSEPAQRLVLLDRDLRPPDCFVAALLAMTGGEVIASAARQSRGARLVEPFVLHFFIRALAFALFRRAFLFAAPEARSIFLGLSLGLRAPPLLAVLVEVDDHPSEASGSQKMRLDLPCTVIVYRCGAILPSANAPLRRLRQGVILGAIRLSRTLA